MDEKFRLGPGRKLDERNAKMVELFLEDRWTYQQIADHFNVSRARVGQVLNEARIAGNEIHTARRERSVLRFIVEYKVAHDGCSPSKTEIMKGVRSRTINGVNNALERLEARGILSNINEPRGIQVVNGYQVAAREMGLELPATPERASAPRRKWIG